MGLIARSQGDLRVCLPLKTRSSAIAGFAFFCRLEKICAGRNFLMGARALGERFNCKKIFAFFLKTPA